MAIKKDTLDQLLAGRIRKSWGFLGYLLFSRVLSRGLGLPLGLDDKSLISLCKCHLCHLEI